LKPFIYYLHPSLHHPQLTGRHHSQKIDENTESFRNFIRRYRNSPITKVAYTDWLRRFVEYSTLPNIRAKTGVEIGDNTDLLLFDDPRKIQNHIKQFIDYQYDVLHLSPKTVDSYYDAVKHFYQSNEVMLNLVSNSASRTACSCCWFLRCLSLSDPDV